jgi:hypothetical protein
MAVKSEADVFGMRPGKRLSSLLGSHATVFQAEMFAILACSKECMVMAYTGERINICSNSQAALQVLVTSRVTSELVCVDRRCVSCLVGSKLRSPGSLVTVGFMVKRKPMSLLGRYRAVHSSVPNQQFRSHLMLVNSRLRSDCRRGTPNTGLLHQV